MYYSNVSQSGLPFFGRPILNFTCKSHTILDENHADINNIYEICGKRMKGVKSVMLILKCLSSLFFAVI